MSETPRQPSEQEIMAMIAQLREAPVRDIILQGLGLIVSGAEAKIGRPDARPLIDVIATVVDVAGENLGDVKDQLDAMVNQLKTAQVQAESQLAEGGEATAAEAPAPKEEKKETDKLWIPGK